MKLTMRFLDPTAHQDHPKQFRSWSDFFYYLLNTWNYSPHNFDVGATRVSPGVYRFMTFAFGMVVTETEVYNKWLLSKKNSKANSR